MPSKIEKQQWEAWLMDPVTEALRAWAQEKRNEFKDMWADGVFKSTDHFQSAIQDSAAHGACSVYKEIEALEFELVIGEQEDGNPKRFGPIVHITSHDEENQ